MKNIRVVAAVIRDADRIFATARGYGEYKGWWEFPGGKIETGESPEEALKREIREELDAEICVGELIDTVEYDYPDFHLSMDCFWCSLTGGHLTLKEAEAARWLTADTIGSVKWLPADDELVARIREKIVSGDKPVAAADIQDIDVNCSEVPELSGSIIADAIRYVSELFSDNSGGHDVDHTMRVYRKAMKIAGQEQSDRNDPGDDQAASQAQAGQTDDTWSAAPIDMQIVALAALLHDADDHKLFNTTDNENARRFLAAHDLPDETIDYICRVINSVSFSQNRGHRPDTPEGCIVQDADRLDAIGAIGIARTFAYGGEHGRPLDDSIEHFYNKLFLIKDELNTDAARKIAEVRHRFMEEFIEEYSKEQ